MKRSLLVILIITAVSISAQAKYSGGSGTAGDPYQIANAADLLALGANTADYDANFILTADINLAPSGPFTTAVIAPDTNNTNSIFDGNAFTGVFEGDFHTIRNLTINTLGAGNDYLGLFGQIGPGGEIKNLAINITITIASSDTSYNVGGLAGYNDRGTINDCRPAGTIAGGNNSQYLGGLVGRNAYGDINDCLSTVIVTHGNYGSHLGGLAGGNYGTISNCHSTGAVTSGNSSVNLGGLVGYNSGTISDCYSTGTITGGAESFKLGGLVGSNSGGSIRNCYSTGKVTGRDTTDNLGGLVGYNDSSIRDCNSRGTITGGNNSNALGGLVGNNNKGGNITKCFATGNIFGGDPSYNMGGLVGYNSFGSISNCYSRGAVIGGNNSNALGGLTGWNKNRGNITHCYSTGNVTGAYHLGGLAGYNTNSSIKNCYFLITSGPDNRHGSPLTDAQMKQQASFVDWNFINAWNISEGISYPKLVTGGEGLIQVTKCTVTAGSKDNSDAISFSGTMDATADNFNGANVVVTIDSNDLVSPLVKAFPISGKTFKNDKFKSSASNASFALDTTTSAFSFTAKKVDLSGLSCPFNVRIEIGDYISTADVNEAIVNGTKPIPINLLMGVKNSLRVDNDKSKFTKKSGIITRLAISGGFSDKNGNDVNLLTNPLDVNVGSQTFTVPASKFKNTNGKFTCSEVDTSNGIAAVTFDFNKCTFMLTIKNTNFATSAGNTVLGIAFAGFSESDVVTLP